MKNRQTLVLTIAFCAALTWQHCSAADKKEKPRKFGADEGRPFLQKSVVKTFPEEIQQGYKLVVIKCSKCHVVTRALNTLMFDKEDWKRYVKRMMNKPNSGISREEGKLIYRFLKYDQEERKESHAEKFFIPETMEKPKVVSWFSEEAKPKNWKD